MHCLRKMMQPHQHFSVDMLHRMLYTVCVKLVAKSHHYCWNLITFYNLDKYILQLWQIQFENLTNTFCNLDKYKCQTGWYNTALCCWNLIRSFPAAFYCFTLPLIQTVLWPKRAKVIEYSNILPPQSIRLKDIFIHQISSFKNRKGGIILSLPQNMGINNIFLLILSSPENRTEQ